MSEPEIISPDPFEDGMEELEPEEFIPPKKNGGNGRSTSLALFSSEQNGAADAIKAAMEATVKAEAGKMAAQMEKRWMEERIERERWVESDDERKERLQRKNARQRIAAMMAAALVSEGAVGTRYTAKQIAKYAIEVADEVMTELDRTERAMMVYKQKDHAAVGARCPDCNLPLSHKHAHKGCPNCPTEEKHQ